MKTKTKVLFDGNCIVCDLEVGHYKRMAPDIFEMVDISQPVFDAAAYGLTSQAVNKHMHVIDPQGQVLVGVDAFAHIWSRLPQYRWGAVVIKWPLVYQAAQVGYAIFARYRHLLPKKSRSISRV
jgi:predicted DCC family thiol-disulfide oxidoreductase YuxK